MDGWTGHVACVRDSSSSYRILVGKPEGKRPFGKPRLRWEDNIKMDLQKVGLRDRDLCDLAQNRDRWGCCECFSVKCGEFLD